MADDELASLQPGESIARDNGERFGRSRGGRMVLMRRRLSDEGFVVTVDAPPSVDEPTEVISREWAPANAAFDRLMHAY
jgi:hypothetical protein